MKATIIFFVSIFIINGSLNAQTNKPDVNVALIGSQKSYRASIYNNQDSILYFITCRMLEPSDYRTDTLILLAPADSDDKNRYHYCPQITSENLRMSREGLAYEAIAIMPYQTKSFDFNVLKGTNEKLFFIDYFYLDCYDHNAFKNEMSDPGWFVKYNRKRVEVMF